MVMVHMRGRFRGGHIDVRVKRSRSVARTTLDAAAAPQALRGCRRSPAPLPRGERESARGTPRILTKKDAPQALRLDNNRFGKLSSLLLYRELRPARCLLPFRSARTKEDRYGADYQGGDGICGNPGGLSDSGVGADGDHRAGVCLADGIGHGAGPQPRGGDDPDL